MAENIEEQTNQAVEIGQAAGMFDQTAMVVGFTLAVGAVGLKLYQVRAFNSIS